MINKKNLTLLLITITLLTISVSIRYLENIDTKAFANLLLILVYLSYVLIIIRSIINVVLYRTLWVNNSGHLIVVCWSLLCATFSVIVIRDWHFHRLTYNLATSSLYILLTFNLIYVFQSKILSLATKLSLKENNLYLYYILLIFSIFLASYTMDQFDPWGPHAQLKAVALALFCHWLLSWWLRQVKLKYYFVAERQKYELAYLSDQLNPHFLFNTLNNLYGLAVERSDKTAQLVNKLTNLMEYTIHQGEKATTTINNEVAYIEDYVNLQSIRFHRPVEVTINKKITNGDFQLAPLLLITLIENAFKHGVDTLTESAYVKIDIVEENEKLAFEVTNNFAKRENTDDSGVGLSNFKKRLFLFYRDSSQYYVKETSHQYQVTLILPQLSKSLIN